MSGFSAAIDLAHEAPFALGALTVRPPTREMARGDGAAEVLEPRVMQVLVALHRAAGAIVSRDDLTQSCWQGRVVGEDAINRVISRLRRTAEGIGEGAFRIETVTKVGYRLVGAAADADDKLVPQAAATLEDAPGASRRGVMAAGLGIGAAALAAAGWWWRPHQPASVSPPDEVAALMTQADLALEQDNREGQNQAIGLYQQVVALKPRYAEGWGGLAEAYALTSHYRATPDSIALRQRALAAAHRALALDPNDARGQVGAADARPAMGNWLAAEHALHQALSKTPDAVPLLVWLSRTMAEVGRTREASIYQEKSAALRATSTPGMIYTRILMLWAAGRDEEADQLMNEGARLYPTHFAVWFARFYAYLYSGRYGAAVAMTADRGNWPSGIAEDEIDRVRNVALAAQSRAPAAIEAVMRDQLAQARRGAGLAENAIQFANLLGRLDEAFSIADAYYLGRGWLVPEVRFTTAQGTYTPRGDRATGLLFWPSTAAMRGDPRFAALVGALGMEAYWRASGHQPDYRRA